MDLFTVKNSNICYKLNVPKYEEITLKQEPYYQDGKNYAVCPGCGNTIQIINLYTNNTVDSDKRSLRMHARHTKKIISDLPKYSEIEYNKCPFANPLSFGSTQKRTSTSEYNEIVDIISNYPDYLHKEINKITGIYFGKNKYIEMLKNFILSEGYNYKYINKYNLPYAFINVQKSINIYGQNIFGNKELSSEIEKSINNKSNYFNVKKSKIEKKVKDYAELKFHFRDHKIIKETGDQSIELVIFENDNKKPNIIFEKRIPIEMYSFIKVLNDVNSLRVLASEMLKNI